MQELQEIALYSDLLGTKAKQLLNLDISKKNPSSSFKGTAAEHSVFALAQQEKCIALTDDIHAARTATHTRNISTRPSFFLLLLLYKEKRITKEDLINDILGILAQRDWKSGALGEYAIMLIEKA